MRPEIILRELSETQWPTIVPFVRQLGRESASAAEIMDGLAEMLPKGYRCVGAYDGETMVGLSGFWISYQFWCGRTIRIDNLAVLPERQGERVGERLVAWIEALGREAGCGTAILDAYTHNHRSHRFYFRHGYVIRGYHFTKPL